MSERVGLERGVPGFSLDAVWPDAVTERALHGQVVVFTQVSQDGLGKGLGPELRQPGYRRCSPARADSSCRMRSTVGS